MADDTLVEERHPRFLVFTAGFRFFFLAAGILAVLSLFAWMLWLGIHAANGMVRRPTIDVVPQFWHAHEMIFGYGAAAVAGFFLTAVPNWTGEPQARTRFVIAVGGLWLLGRATIWFSASLPPLLVAAVDLAFLPPLIVRVGWNLRRNPQRRNLVFVAVLAAFAVANLMVHLEWLGVTDDTLLTGLYLGILLLAAMIAIIGGRVVPAFTRNALRRRGEEEPLPTMRPAVDRAAIASAILLALAVFLRLSDPLIGGLALATALANGWRLFGWRTAATLRDPLLWSLHLGFAMLVVGYAALALALLTGVPSEIGAYHVLGIGAVGGMTLAVMSRAALGHTGRPLAAPVPMSGAYACVALAAVIRGFGTDLLPDWYYTAIFLSGGLWVLGFALYLAAYWEILTGPDARAVAALEG